MIELLSTDELKELLEGQKGYCTSMFMPTHRKGREIEQDPIRFRNLLHRAGDLLIDEGLRSPEAHAILEPAERLLEDAFFWKQQGDGLAVFLAKGVFHLYRLPLRFDELVVVSRHFHIKPLFPLFAPDGRFFILSLGQRHVRLFQGSKYSLSEIELKDVPPSIEEALKFDDAEKENQFQRRTAMVHGQGISTDDVGYKNNILRYFHIVDHGLHTVLRDENAPLVLAGLDYQISMYREANSYPYIMDEGITANPEGMSTEEIHQQAWSIMRPYFQKKQQDAVLRYRKLSGTGLTSHSLDEIVKSSFHDRIDTLFITSGIQKWGRYDPVSDEVIIHREMEVGDEDLLDLASVQALLHGGIIYMPEAENMPDGYPVAAVFRF
ncbi:MAG: hypothetical protein ACMUIA_07130 [bacterium]